MKRVLLLVMTLLLCSVFALGYVPRKSSDAASHHAARVHRIRRHRAHKAGRHHRAKHHRHGRSA
jgi:hypothetical protein